jgi:5'(3')-deoxyribonucleotidase
MTPNPASKPMIAVDVDDVLAANAEAFVEYSNEKWGTNLTVDDYDEHWAVAWGVNQNDHEELEKRSLQFLRDTTSKYKHFPEAKAALEKLSKEFDLVVVTSRRTVLSKDTLEWIDKYFPDIFQDVHFAGIWDEVAEGRINITKADIIKQIGADYLIDDQPKHCIAAAGAGIKALLFGDYRWNRDVELPENVHRVKSWQEVLEYFDGR